MFVAAATKRELLDPKKSPYRDYAVNLGKGERENLQPEELTLLENVDRRTLGSARLEQVLDRFLYSCYTGLRIGDNILLSRKHIKKTSDGLVVDMMTEKGKGQHVVYLFNGKSQAIVEKYLRLYPDQPTIFPPETRSALGYYLKQVAKQVGIERNLFFHSSRHTFAILLVSSGSEIYTVSKMLTHKNVSTTQIHADLIFQFVS
ncbi:MAG: site-specific integrase [Prevotellaceae bacterium]|jgi:site-specific recombinase XerD|nr:site-specific integrase [Prevotellaceae bacterium]